MLQISPHSPEAETVLGRIARWTSPDPYDEYASGYVGMGNDPANLTDPSGGSISGSIGGDILGGAVLGGLTGAL